MTTPFSREPLTAPTYPSTLDEQLRALETDEWVLRLAESRRRLADVDPYRPLFHFSSPESYMNDPNGLCQWRGRYHMFYQFKPTGVDRVHWGHTVSDDLVRWRDMPPALYPDVERDCFSGQTLVESDRVIAIYHGTQSGNAIATASDPLLMNWQKHPNNPVIPGTNQGVGAAADTEYSIPASGKRTTATTPSQAPTRAETAAGTAWVSITSSARRTCPSGSTSAPCWKTPSSPSQVRTVPSPHFWPIGNDRHMLLLFSHKRAGRYYIGRYDRTDAPLHSRRLTDA